MSYHRERKASTTSGAFLILTTRSFVLMLLMPIIALVAPSWAAAIVGAAIVGSVIRDWYVSQREFGL